MNGRLIDQAPVLTSRMHLQTRTFMRGGRTTWTSRMMLQLDRVSLNVDHAEQQLVNNLHRERLQDARHGKPEVQHEAGDA